MNKITIYLIIGSLAVWLTGCQLSAQTESITTEAAPVPLKTDDSSDKTKTSIEQSTLSKSVVTPDTLVAQNTNALPVHTPEVAIPVQAFSMQGRPLVYSTHGSGTETVMFIGGMHGDESASTILLEFLDSYLEVYPLETKGKQVVIVPAVNPDGLARKQRTNARGVDINRNFGTGNRKPSRRHGARALSEPETVFVTELIQYYKPQRIMNVHQDLNCIDWDGPAKPLAYALAEASGMPLKKLGARPGSLGSYAGLELNIPIITLELPGLRRHSPEQVWQTYGEILLNFIIIDEGRDVRIPSHYAEEDESSLKPNTGVTK